MRADMVRSSYGACVERTLCHPLSGGPRHLNVPQSVPGQWWPPSAQCSFFQIGTVALSVSIR